MTAAPVPHSLILYERDDAGVPFAIEEVRAVRWEPRLALPPDPAEADVRVVHLERGPAPAHTPPWLAVDVRSRGVGELVEDYVVDDGLLYERPGQPDTSRRLWPASPYHREPSAALEEFLRAGATALRYPDAPPVDLERQAEALRAFTRGRQDFAPLGALRAAALERWFHVRYNEPERFADAILVERVEAAAPAQAALMRFLREATVPHGLVDAADLAVDRMVLLEQLSPWRTLEGASMTSAVAAALAWQRRYRRAYEAHYRRALGERDAVLAHAEAHAARLATLERLNGIDALGDPEGEEAAAAERASLAALVAMPDHPDALAATTAGLPLGEPNRRATDYLDAVEAVERALSGRLRRLSGALAACALQHDDDLRAVLDAIALSEVDHLDRVLDDRLAARIEALLTAAARSPLTVVAQQFPEVTLANLEAAVEEFRRAARQAIDTSPEGRTPLGGFGGAGWRLVE
ncbi:MAG: hypothetical protein AB7G21_06900 [Dehalococcoidia bacterium]